MSLPDLVITSINSGVSQEPKAIVSICTSRLHTDPKRVGLSLFQNISRIPPYLDPLCVETGSLNLFPKSISSLQIKQQCRERLHLLIPSQQNPSFTSARLSSGF